MSYIPILFKKICRGFYFEFIISFVQTPLHETSLATKGAKKKQKNILLAFSITFFNAFSFLFIVKGLCLCFFFLMTVVLDHID
jgi:hypothetical protein